MRHRNAFVSGEKYTSTDRLRIRHGDKAAYIELELYFFNGHECMLSGIAALHGDALVYRDPDEAEYDCRLEMQVQKGKLVFSDLGGKCRRMTCGARGGYEGTTFPLSARRPLKNAAAFRRSEEFKEALEAFEKLPKENGTQPAGKP